MIKIKLREKTDAIPEKDYLPAMYFDIFHHGQRVGKCDLRIGHNNKTYIGGNIGYSIFELYRGHHYATKACFKLFEIAKKEGMKYVIITCFPDNTASKKTIEKCGGHFIEKCAVPEDNEMYAIGAREVLVYKIEIA